MKVHKTTGASEYSGVMNIRDELRGRLDDALQALEEACAHWEDKRRDFQKAKIQLNVAVTRQAEAHRWLVEVERQIAEAGKQSQALTEDRPDP